MTKRAWWSGLAIVVIMLMAVGWRFYDLPNYPPGLFPDEAANGEDALLVLDGDVRAFYPRGNGREGLFFILEAMAIKIFGIGVWPLHLVSAVIGVLTVGALYWATKIWFGRLAGLLAALMLATNHWHVTMSRTGFRAILIPLFLALFTAWVGYTVAAVRAKKKGWSYGYAALAGAALAGGFYTYIAYRVMVGVVGGIVFLLMLAALHPKIGWPHWRRYGSQIAVGVAATILVLAPLGWHFVQQPVDIIGRAGQVSVFNPDLQEKYGGGTLAGTIYYSTRETLLSFFAGEGDLNWRHNVAGFPLLNPLVGLLALLGLAWALRGTGVVFRKLWRGEEVHMGMIYPYLLLLAGGMLLPVITTAEGMPHGLRSIGLVLPLFMLAGTAGAVVAHWFIKRFAGQSLLAAGGGVLIGLLVLGVIYDGALYFLIARNDAQAHYAYRADLTEVTEYIQDLKIKPYLVLDKFSLQTVHFLLSVQAHEYTTGDMVHPDEEKHRYRSVEPEKSYEIDLMPGEIIIFTQSSLVDANWYEKIHPGVVLIESAKNRFGQEIYRVYEGIVEPEVEGVKDVGEYGLDA